MGLLQEGNRALTVPKRAATASANSADIKGQPKQKQRLGRYLAKSPIQRPVHNAAVTMATVAGHPRKPPRPLTAFWLPLQKRGFLAAVPLRLWLPGGQRMQRRWGGVER